jgi:hypothetical protein
MYRQGMVSERIFLPIVYLEVIEIERQKPRRSLRPRMSEDVMSCLPETN